MLQEVKMMAIVNDELVIVENPNYSTGGWNCRNQKGELIEVGPGGLGRLTCDWEPEEEVNEEEKANFQAYCDVCEREELEMAANYEERIEE